MKLHVHMYRSCRIKNKKKRLGYVCALRHSIHHLQSCWQFVYHNLKTASNDKMIYRCKICNFLIDLEFVLHNTQNEDEMFSHARFLHTIYRMLHLFHANCRE